MPATQQSKPRVLVTSAAGRTGSVAARMLLTPSWDVAAWERERGFPLLKNAELAHDSEAWTEAAGRQSLLLAQS
jgi:hypothetical protein